jgi:hypothetical protein
VLSAAGIQVTPKGDAPKRIQDAFRKAKPGQKLEIVVLRAGRKVKLVYVAEKRG